MNILIISTQNPFKTSGIVAKNLYDEFKKSGYNTKILVNTYDKYYSKDIISMETSFDLIIKDLKYKYNRILKRLNINNKSYRTDIDYHIQDFDQTQDYYNTKNILKKIKFKPDVILYLFQQNFLTTKNLYELYKSTGAKIFWYLMDTAPLTGACHYSWDCEGYKIGCGKCPALYSTDKNDQSSINLNFKNEYLSKTEIEIIVATEWQKKMVLSSFLFKNNPIHKILLTIDPNVFSYVSKIDAKEKIGIRSEKKVIFFGATSINIKRKGMNHLIDSLYILKENYKLKTDNIVLLIAGSSSTLFNSLPYEFIHLGLLENNEQLASAYQAADVFVCPSIEDAGPMMINQAIMTGTPVVSFEMGVALDLVITGKTGYLAKLKDNNDFAKGIKTILELESDVYSEMRNNCRNLSLQLYHPDVMKKQFENIFKKYEE